MSAALLQDAGQLVALAGARYGLAYGSHATAGGPPDSDLDLLFLVDHELAPARAAELELAVVELHRRHGLHLDTEVAYAVKLTATGAEVSRALALAGFADQKPGQPPPPALLQDSAYLNSPMFKLRLVLNALSSPNVFLGGDVASFEWHRRAAARASAELAMRLLLDEPVTLAAAVEVLLTGPRGARHKDHLGYVDAAALASTVAQGLHQLRAAGVLATEDSVTWRPRRSPQRQR